MIEPAASPAWTGGAWVTSLGNRDAEELTSCRLVQDFLFTTTRLVGGTSVVVD